MPHFGDPAVFCPCQEDEEAKISRQIDKTINREMEKHRQYAREEIKMLLLGTREAGKSTIVKQMRIIHGLEFQDEKSRLVFVQSVRENVMEIMRTLLQNMDKFNIAMVNKQNHEHLRRLNQSATQAYDPAAAPMLFSSIAALWEDAGVRESHRRRGDFKFTYLSDSSKYFLDRIAIIADPNYVPTEQDILRVRQSSTGIQEYSFKVKNVNFRMVDVGGQRSERRKWIHCFENVTAMIFVASLSDYDQLLLDSTSQPGEEKAVNRMEESFALFDVVVKERFLQTASIILFLNKTDVFQEKIQKKDLEDFFPDYARFHLKNENVICSPKKDSAAAIQFILSKYAEVIRKHAESGFGCDFKKRTNSTDSEQEHMLYSHLTCATDKENMKFITAAVEDHILWSAVSEINLL